MAADEGDEESVRTGPDIFKIQPLLRRPVLSVLGLAGYIDGKSCKVPDGRPGIAGVGLFAHADHPRLFEDARRAQYGASYPPLGKGDVIRVIDGLYCVTEIAPLTFTRLHEADYPGAIVHRNAYPFVIGEGGGLEGKGFRISKRLKTLDDGKIQVEVTVITEKDPALKPQFLSEGSIFWTGKYGRRVLSVVPSDPEKDLIGYIEIDQKIEVEKE
jgi:hypothetical protein